MVRPILDPGFLNAESDLERLAFAVRESLELAGTDPLSQWLGRAVGAELSALDELQLRTWVREHAVSQFHMAGSCKLGVDEMSVVDPDHRVRGVEGLRVVDASVMPQVVSGHCQAAILAIAERAADRIAADA